MKILALTKYGDLAASARQRVLQYRPFLGREGVDLEASPLLDNVYLEQTFSGQAPPLRRVLVGYANRLNTLLRRRDFDVIWLQYELFPYVAGVVERLAFLSGKPVVCDYDDAIFHQYDSHPSAIVRKISGRKLQPLLRGARLCICGNRYIENFARQFCRQTTIVPTVLDTTAFRPSNEAVNERTVTVGWIGSPSTWSYVKPLVPLLSRLSRELDLRIQVVGAGPQETVSPGFEFKPWSEASEITAIQGMDIGIMPLPDAPWARGKCGYKLIQYMACGVPVIASPVGVNSEIVQDGGNGFLATTDTEWETALRGLVASSDLRSSMGDAGRKKIIQEYSLQVHGPRLARIFVDVIRDGQNG